MSGWIELFAKRSHAVQQRDGFIDWPLQAAIPPDPVLRLQRLMYCAFSGAYGVRRRALKMSNISVSARVDLRDLAKAKLLEIHNQGPLR